MSLAQVVIVGAGGHAKVVIDMIEQRGDITIAGCTAPAPHPSHVFGHPVLGDDSVLTEVFASGIRLGFVAIGDNVLRARKSELMRSIGFSLVNVISPRAAVSRRATIGSGVAIMPGALINADATIGDGAIINTGAIVDHDGQIGDWAHICPGAALAGMVRIGCGALVGTGAAVKPGVSIGDWATVGAGSVVIRDLPARVTAAGVPAATLKSNHSRRT